MSTLATLTPNEASMILLPRPLNPGRIRCELDKDTADALGARARALGLSSAAFARCALELLAAGRTVSPTDVKARAEQIAANEKLTHRPRGVRGRPKRGQ